MPDSPAVLRGEISGLSRSVSNLGSSLGTAVAGTILVAGFTTRSYAAAMVTLALLGLLGLAAAALLPHGARSGRGAVEVPATDGG
ncbi:hypothetical protein [Streptomyces aureus]